MVQKAPVANGQAAIDLLDLVDGTLVSVQPVVFNTITGTFVIRSPGKYYVFIARVPGRSNTTLQELLWGGYVDGGAQASICNLECYKPQQLSATVFSDSSPIAGDLIQIWATISPGTHPRGGSSIHYQPPFTGEGDKLTIQLGDPAAGAVYPTQVVPAQVKWRVRGMFGQLVTSAVAANRYLAISYRDAAGFDYAFHASGAIQAASITTNWSAVVGVGPNYTNDFALPAAVIRRPVIPLQDEKLRTGFQITFPTNAIDVGDNWGPGSMGVEEWAGPSA